MRLAGKVAIVTGTGSGIGEAIAVLFAAEGARVLLASREAHELERVRARIPGEADTAVVDVAKGPDVERMVAQAVARWGRLDVLVNNAGVMDGFTPAAETSDDLWRHVLGVNLDGVFYACRAALPHFLRQKSGAIVNVASIGGLFGARAGAAYTASKHAVVGLSKNIAYMYAREGVRCNAIAPGGVATHIMAGMPPHAAGQERVLAGMGSNVRIGQPEEIATLALFLASDDASYLNGAVVTADGGWTAY